MEKLYDLNEVSEYLGLSLQTLRKLIKKGELVASKIGTRYLVTESNLKAYVEASTVTPGAI